MNKQALSSVAVALVVLSGLAGYLTGTVAPNRLQTTTSSVFLTSTSTSYSTTTTTATFNHTTTTTLSYTTTTTATVNLAILSSEGPIAIFPLAYHLPPPTTSYYNSTFVITRVNNYTLTNIARYNTNLTAVYGKIIQSQSFQAAVQGRFWVVAYWDFYYLNSRPVVESFFILPNSNGTIYGYLTPVFYYFDNSQVSVTFTKTLTSG